MDSPPLYTRRLSPLERYSLALHEAHDYQVVVVAEGQGEPGIVALQRACAVAAEANPGVRVRLRGALTLTKWVDSGIAPEVRAIEASGWDGASERGAEFLQDRSDPLRGGPVADVLVLYGPGRRTRLVFRGHHAAFDGRGLKHWMADIFRVLRGEAPVGSRSTLTDHDIRVQNGGRVVDPGPPAPIPAIPILPPVSPTSDLSHVWRRVIIPRHSSNTLVRSALFLGEWARRRESGAVTFRVPVDYRGLRTSEISVGNLIGYLRLTVGEDDTPRSLTRQLTQQLRDYADCREIPGLEKLHWQPVRRLARRLRRSMASGIYAPETPSGGLVSMGLLDLEDACFPEFRAELVYGIPPPVGRLNVIITDFPDHSVVLFSVPAACDTGGQLDELVDAYLAHLLA